MSLQVWLPLNGNLNNQGLANVSHTAGTPQYKTPGKISNNALDLKTRTYFSCEKLANLQTFSVAFWALASSSSSLTTNWQDLIGFVDVSSGGTAGTFRWETTYASANGIHWHDNTTNAFVNNSHNHITVKDVWVHCCVVFNNELGKIYSYDNGVLKQTDTHLGGKFNSTGSFYLGETNNIEGMIQDVRFYDHALSTKEVEEIAKGLVLHYKLDDVSNNLDTTSNLRNLIWNGNANEDTVKWTNWGTATNRSIVNINGKKWFHHTSDSSGNKYGGFNQDSTEEIIKPNTNYTISALMYASTSTQMRFWYHMRSSEGGANLSQPSKTFTITTAPTIYSYTFNSGTNANYTINRFNIMIGSVNNNTENEVYVTDIMMTEGTDIIPYMPNPNDTAYAAMGQGINTVYDSSGYDNNGTIVGSLTVTTPSPRYSCATKMTNGQYIRVDNRPNVCMPKDAITVNLWQYATSWSNPISCTEGGGWNFENNNGIRFPVYIYGVGYKVAQSSITPASTQNAWHMLTGTMDKDNIKIYYDGEEVGTTVNGSTNGIGYANNYIFIGAEASGDNTSPASSSYTGNLSDIRIYATALTPEQIKELYNTSMTIDNQGNIHARELVE